MTIAHLCAFAATIIAAAAISLYIRERRRRQLAEHYAAELEIRRAHDIIASAGASPQEPPEPVRRRRHLGLYIGGATAAAGAIGAWVARAAQTARAHPIAAVSTVATAGLVTVALVAATPQASAPTTPQGQGVAQYMTPHEPTPTPTETRHPELDADPTMPPEEAPEEAPEPHRQLLADETHMVLRDTEAEPAAETSDFTATPTPTPEPTESDEPDPTPTPIDTPDPTPDPTPTEPPGPDPGPDDEEGEDEEEGRDGLICIDLPPLIDLCLL